MSDWRNTVMNNGQCLRASNPPYHNLQSVAEAQAELTWKAREPEIEEARKAGYETGRDAYKEEMLHEEFDPQAELFGWFLDHGWTPPAELPVKLEEAKLAGRREVVEWIIKNSYGFDKGDGVMVRKIIDGEWQAKLKEWG